LASKGLAVLRPEGRCVSLECGQLGGGHGHPDRLHLTLHAGGVHWLADPGTGSYVARDLFWYRSTLAHNAPRLDQASQPPGDAMCEAWDAPGEWAWVRGRYGEVTRTVIAGPAYVLDIVELGSRSDHVLELPWHFVGTGDAGGGKWTAGELVDEFVSRVERFVPDHAGPVVLDLADGPAQLKAYLVFDGELLRAEGPDGTVRGFNTTEPLRLELEDQYRRSEEAYSGPDDFSAVAYAAWDEAALYLAVEVTKPDDCFRPAGAPPLRLDNEPDDVHSD